MALQKCGHVTYSRVAPYYYYTFESNKQAVITQIVSCYLTTLTIHLFLAIALT